MQAQLKAGCALPLLYRGPIQVEQHSLVDGGLVDPIPAREAHRRGARRILVIRSRPSTTVKRAGAFDGVIAAMLRGQPAIAGASRLVAQRYREAVAFLQTPPADTLLFELAPEQPLATGRTTQDQKALHADYQLGLQLARRHAERIGQLLLG
jgi:predicted patatin/cPLA2 family phospholipase